MASGSDDTEDSPIPSLAAYQILDENGISEAVIKSQALLLGELEFFMNCAITVVLPCSKYIFTGSVADGLSQASAISGHNSDADIMDVRCFFIAMNNLDEYVDDPSLCQFLLEKVQDNPAYVKLRLISLGNNLYNLLFYYNGTMVQSGDNALYLSSSEVKIIAKMLFIGVTILNIFSTLHQITSMNITGPATSVNVQNINFGTQNGHSLDKVDLVFSIPCPSWPDVALEWIGRPRFHNWPTKEMINQISSKGCYLVPKSRAESRTKNLYWSISFSHIEPSLIHSMNDVMIKTYSILKCVHKSIFQVEIGDVVSSYILKTALFWEVEETNIEQWTPENIFLCVKRCLERVRGWFDSNCAPHYFIRVQNLFPRTLTSSLRQKASRNINDVIGDFENLFQNIMPFVLCLRNTSMEEVVDSYYESDGWTKSTEFKDFLSKGFNRLLTAYSSCILPFLLGGFVGRHSSNHWESIDSLRQVICRIFKNQTPTMPRVFILSTLMQRISFLELIKAGQHLRGNKCKYRTRKLSKNMLRLCLIPHTVVSLSNLITYVLRCAFLQDFQRMERAIHFITQLHRRSEVLRFNYLDQNDSVRESQKIFNGTAISENNAIETFVMVSTEYPLTHIELQFLPPVLLLELECRFAVEQNLNPLFRLSNENVLSLDSEALFYFVSFCFYHQRDKNIEKYTYLQKLERLTQNESVVHLHIALNLLGYCHMLMSQHREAFITYHRSLCNQVRNRDLKTVSKATPYHVAILFYKCFSDEWSKTS
ncbi:hypothetical protein FSP39_024415 [Pinctada imbricata]|uniref:Mab-21-like HhH/H2TH-like domain-containing protein n=1 Tax=Pinctada imbricata TaxID=66713 RepID=A0AA88YT63_PINIB|nr:hypothetical protein FSP39_024415 [Pinctada imbricata]